YGRRGDSAVPGGRRVAVHAAALRRDGILDGMQQASYGCGNLQSRESRGSALFQAKGMRHHHFICDRCGNVEDLEWYAVPRPASGTLGKRILRECELIFR